MNREEMIARSGDSHLEQVFSAALWEEGWRPCAEPDFAISEIGPVTIAWHHPTKDNFWCDAVPQVRVDAGATSIVVDYAFFTLGSGRVFVELDGHAYHERTPEQASRDRAIDRALQLDAVVVLRFTHLELTRYMPACIADLYAAIRLQNERFEFEEAASRTIRQRRARVAGGG